MQWQTATEIGVAGFVLLAEFDGGTTPLNHDLIRSPVIDSVTPTDYTFFAATDATRFVLQEVTIDGGTVDHGPFELGEVHGTRIESENDALAPMLWIPQISQ